MLYLRTFAPLRSSGGLRLRFMWPWTMDQYLSDLSPCLGHWTSTTNRCFQPGYSWFFLTIFYPSQDPWWPSHAQSIGQGITEQLEEILNNAKPSLQHYSEERSGLQLEQCSDVQKPMLVDCGGIILPNINWGFSTINHIRRKFRSQTSDNRNRWKSRGGKSQRGE